MDGMPILIDIKKLLQQTVACEPHREWPRRLDDSSRFNLCFARSGRDCGHHDDERPIRVKAAFPPKSPLPHVVVPFHVVAFRAQPMSAIRS
jgi:hypothetical protein